MKEKINFFLKNSNYIDEIFMTQQKNFENNDFNYKTIKNIENFIDNR